MYSYSCTLRATDRPRPNALPRPAQHVAGTRRPPALASAPPHRPSAQTLRRQAPAAPSRAQTKAENWNCAPCVVPKGAAAACAWPSRQTQTERVGDGNLKPTHSLPARRAEAAGPSRWRPPSCPSGYEHDDNAAPPPRRPRHRAAALACCAGEPLRRLLGRVAPSQAAVHVVAQASIPSVTSPPGTPLRSAPPPTHLPAAEPPRPQLPPMPPPRGAQPESMRGSARHRPSPPRGLCRRRRGSTAYDVPAVSARASSGRHGTRCDAEATTTCAGKAGDVVDPATHEARGSATISQGLLELHAMFKR